MLESVLYMAIAGVAVWAFCASAPLAVAGAAIVGLCGNENSSQ